MSTYWAPGTTRSAFYPFQRLNEPGSDAPISERRALRPGGPSNSQSRSVTLGEGLERVTAAESLGPTPPRPDYCVASLGLSFLIQMDVTRSPVRT